MKEEEVGGGISLRGVLAFDTITRVDVWRFILADYVRERVWVGDCNGDEEGHAEGGERTGREGFAEGRVWREGARLRAARGL